MTNNNLWISQAASIPLRGNQLCLVTSRSGKRWVIPKGVLEPGKTACEIALQEAWEEAGLVGVLHSPHPVGSYLYQKSGSTCYVTVFILQVSQVADAWPESELRERCWVTCKEALDRLDDPGLREILRSLMPADKANGLLLTPRPQPVSVS